MADKTPVQKSSSADIQRFLTKVGKLPIRSSQAGRLLFAIDATASRQPSWDLACGIQGEMFSATKNLGGINTQLCYYRGFNEFHHSPWFSRSADLLRQMQSVFCLGGHTQIARVIEHALAESKTQKINSVIFIGDACEENVDALANLAGQLGIRGIPLFVFHEGVDSVAGSAFKQMAKLSGGAYLPFNHNSAQALSALLGAIAIYSTGGLKALKQHGDKAATKQLTYQLEKN